MEGSYGMNYATVGASTAKTAAMLNLEIITITAAMIQEAQSSRVRWEPHFMLFRQRK